MTSSLPKVQARQRWLRIGFLLLCFGVFSNIIIVRPCLAQNDATFETAEKLGKIGTTTLLSLPDARVDSVRDRKSYFLMLKPTLGATIKIPLFNTPWDIRSMKTVMGQKFVVDQPTSGSSDRIYIVDIANGRVVESFGCEKPSISPDGRYLAFVAAYPMHPQDISLASNFAMLYRFDLDVIKNLVNFRNDSLFDDGDDDLKVGLQLFPQFRTPIDMASPTPDKRRLYFVMSDFVWSADSTRLLFLDDQDPGAYDDAPTGNLKLFEAAARESSLLLVNVDLSHSVPVVTAVTAPSCSQISGIACELDLAHARIEKDRISVNEVLSGRENATKTLQIDFASFKRPTIQ